MLDALKKVAASSKVWIFLIFCVALTVSLKLGYIDKGWYESTLANGFLVFMGGYSLVDFGRSLVAGKVDASTVLGKIEQAVLAAVVAPPAGSGAPSTTTTATVTKTVTP